MKVLVLRRHWHKDQSDQNDCMDQFKGNVRPVAKSNLHVYIYWDPKIIFRSMIMYKRFKHMLKYSKILDIANSFKFPGGQCPTVVHQPAVKQTCLPLICCNCQIIFLKWSKAKTVIICNYLFHCFFHGCFLNVTPSVVVCSKRVTLHKTNQHLNSCFKYVVSSFL